MQNNAHVDVTVKTPAIAVIADGSRSACKILGSNVAQMFVVVVLDTGRNEIECVSYWRRLTYLLFRRVSRKFPTVFLAVVTL